MEALLQSCKENRQFDSVLGASGESDVVVKVKIANERTSRLSSDWPCPERDCYPVEIHFAHTSRKSVLLVGLVALHRRSIALQISCESIYEIGWRTNYR